MLYTGYNRPNKGHDAGDHPPITPIKAATKDELNGAEWKVYSFIARSFLGCVSTDAIYERVAVVFDAAGETFKLKGRTLTHSGFLEIMTWHESSDIKIPNFKINEQVKVVTNKII